MVKISDITLEDNLKFKVLYYRLCQIKFVCLDVASSYFVHDVKAVFGLHNC